MTRLLILAISFSLLFNLSSIQAQRPSTSKLLPDWTLAMIRVKDTTELSEKFSKTGFSQMLKDEELKPFLESVYGSTMQFAQELEQSIGMTIDQILEIPEGELLVAMVAPPAFGPSPVFIMDLPTDTETVDDLLDHGAEVLKQNGYSAETQDYQGVEFEVYSGDGDGPENVIRFEKDGTLVIAADIRAAERLVDNWLNGEEDCLQDNQAYNAIADRCQGNEGEADMFFFVDPIGIAKAATRGNFGAAAGLAFLPAIGLDGFQGFGGSVSYPDSEFESIAQWHIYLENPRDGVLEMITLKDGDGTPEDWAPKELITYSTFHFDLQKTYSILKDLVDSFREEGSLAKLIKNNISDNIGVDFEQEFIAQLDGRVTMIQVYERPPRLNSQSTSIALKLRDRERFEANLDKITDQFSEFIHESLVDGEKVFRIGDDDEEDEDEDADDGLDVRRAQERRIEIQSRPKPTFVLLDDYLIFADRPSTIKNFISAKNNEEERLTEAEDFQRVMEKMSQQPGADSASVVAFSRPAEAIGALYELIASEEALEFIKTRRDDNPAFQILADALDEHPLPPFSKLKKFLPPTGGIMTNEETGIHSYSFSLRYEDDE